MQPQLPTLLNRVDVLIKTPAPLRMARWTRGTFLLSAACLLASLPARADTQYWNNTTTTWGTSTNWSSNSNGTGAGAVPTASTDVTFNNTTVNGAETVTLASGDAAQGVTFANTGATSFTGGNLTIGSDGLTINSGAGQVNQGTTTMIIGTSQSWTNNSSTGYSAQNNGFAASSSTTAATLTFAAGGWSVRGGLADGTGGGALSLVVAGGSSVTFNNTGANTYTGGTTIKSGSIRVNQTVSGVGSGLITLGDSSASTAAGMTFVNGGTVSNAVTTTGSGVDTLAIGGSGNTDTYTNTITLNNTTNALLLTTTASSGSTPTFGFSGLITGGGGIAMARSGSNLNNLNVNISHANDFSGGTTINYGTLTVQNTAALGAAGAAVSLGGAGLDLQTDSSVNAYNVSLIGNGTIASDKATAGSAGITHTLGTLNIAGNTLNTTAGTNVSGGTPIVAFGATTLTSTSGTTSTFNPTTAGVTLTTVTGSAASTKTDTLSLAGSATTNGISGAITNGSGGGNVAVSTSGSGTWLLGGSNTYSGATTVGGTSTLLLGTGATTGTGTLTVGAGATFGGSGSSSVAKFTASGSGTTTATRATILVGNIGPADLNTSGTLSMTGSAASTISNATLSFNEATATASGNQLSVGSTALTFGNGTAGAAPVTLALNLQGGSIIAPNTAYVLVAGTLPGTSALTSQYSGLTFGTSTGSLATGLITPILSGNNLLLSFGSTAAYYGTNSYLFLYQSSSNGGIDNIEVQVVPEPGTWAMMLGGLAVLIFWQRRVRRG